MAVSQLEIYEAAVLKVPQIFIAMDAIVIDFVTPGKVDLIKTFEVTLRELPLLGDLSLLSSTFLQGFILVTVYGDFAMAVGRLELE